MPPRSMSAACSLSLSFPFRSSTWRDRYSPWRSWCICIKGLVERFPRKRESRSNALGPRPRGRAASPPNFVGQLDDHPQLGPLLVLGKHIAFFGGSETALRRQAQLFERRELGRFLDAAFD